MKHTDYKFWYIKRDDNGFITEAAIRFYEGNYQIIDGEEKYIRTKRLNTFKDLKHLARKVKGVDTIKGLTDKAENLEGDTGVLYHPDEFGLIKTDEELCAFLNKELAKDNKRSTIIEQQVK